VAGVSRAGEIQTDASASEFESLQDRGPWDEIVVGLLELQRPRDCRLSQREVWVYGRHQASFADRGTDRKDGPETVGRPELPIGPGSPTYAVGRAGRMAG
jgi:hypothetical protein